MIRLDRATNNPIIQISSSYKLNRMMIIINLPFSNGWLPTTGEIKSEITEEGKELS
jgi:hypothetical protein